MQVNKYAFSGGKVEQAEQREHGADLDVDVAYQWMFFFCDDDDKLQKLADEYGPGPVRAGNKMLTGEAKALLIETLKPIIATHQKVTLSSTFCHADGGVEGERSLWDLTCFSDHASRLCSAMQARAAVTDAMVEAFMNPRQLVY